MTATTDTTVLLVGAGPGDPDLLTIAAEDALRTAEVIVADAGLAELVADLAPDAATVLVGDRTSAGDDLVALCAPGVRTVRLYTGDPWRHPGYQDEADRLAAAGLHAVAVAGVTTELALLAAAGIPLHVRHLAVAATLTDDAGIKSLPPLRHDHTVVVSVPDGAAGARHLLDAQPQAAALPAATVGTGPIERGVVRAALGDLPDLAPPEPALLVVGAVAAQGVDAIDDRRVPRTDEARTDETLTAHPPTDNPSHAAADLGGPHPRSAGADETLTDHPPTDDPTHAAATDLVVPTRPSAGTASTAGHDAVRGASTVHVVGLLGGRPVGAEATEAVQRAGLVAGSADQLRAVADLLGPDATTTVVAGGLGALDDVATHHGPVAVLASGDPGFHGIGRVLAARLGSERLVVHPAPSSVARAFARLGLPWDDAVVRSAHTGDADRAAADLVGAASGAVLCGPASPPETMARALLARGSHHRIAAVATRLDEPGESVTVADLATIAAGTFDHRSVLVVSDTDPAAVAATGRPGGRPVGDFAHRAGMITKPEVRSVVLGKLDLPGRGVLWDVGSGSGSVAIEAALAAPGLRVIAVERRVDDAERIVGNAAALGAVVEVVTGAAPEALADLPTPDRVFVGGGGLDALDAAWAALRPGGRLVATFAAVDRAAEAHRRLGALVQVAVDRAEVLPDGGVRFAADNPVFVAWGDAPAEPVTAVESDGAAAALVVGVGCSTTATADDVRAVVADALDGLSTQDLAAPESDRDAQEPAVVPAFVATIDRRVEHPALRAVATAVDVPIVGFPSALLATVDVPSPSAAAAEAVGTHSVAEAAALLAAGPGARLVVTKRRNETATAAVARPAPAWSRRRAAGGGGKVTVVGLGPGPAIHRTPAATTAVRAADAVVGYGPYVDTVTDLLRPDQRVIRSGMGDESERAAAALALAGAGWTVAVVSSGDPGVFGMASTVLEARLAAARPSDPIDHDWADHDTTDHRPTDHTPTEHRSTGHDSTDHDKIAHQPTVAIEVVPGVTAAHAGAAAVGAPLAGAHAVLSLSDILVSWATIESQLQAAARSGLPVALYNPRSAGRPDHLDRARGVLLDVLATDTPCAVVTAAGGADQVVEVTTLAALDPTAVGMRSVVLIGSGDTVPVAGGLLTSRHHPAPDRGETR